MRKILFLTHRVPYPPDRGDRIRSHHLLRFLSDRAEVSLGCVTQEPVGSLAIEALQQLCKRVAVEPTTRISRIAHDLSCLCSGRSATEGHFWSRRLARTLEDWAEVEQFDFILCFCSGMYRYARLPKLNDIPVAVDLVDVDSLKWAECAQDAAFPLSWLYRLESTRVRKLERDLSRYAEQVYIISQDEKDLLRKAIGVQHARVAVNGVDLVYFSPRFGGPVEELSCCFVGVLDYLPNVDAILWFTSKVWGVVRERHPSARLRVIGRNPTRAIRRLASMPGVSVHADVADVRPYLAESRVAVAPLRIARGIQNKVLEAMAMGKPVVASPDALTGIDAKPDRDLLVASEAPEWARRIDTLFAHPDIAEALACNARRFVESRHNWSTCLQPFELITGSDGVGHNDAHRTLYQSLSRSPR